MRLPNQPGRDDEPAAALAVNCRVRCGSCLTAGPWVDSAEEARILAYQAGWRRSTAAPINLCPECQR